MRIGIVAMIVLLLLVGGCGGAAGADYAVALETQPSPIQNGRLGTVVLRVKDKDGQPLKGAKVSYRAEHVGMGHGAVTGVAEEKEPGVYQGGLLAPMRGTYALTVTIEGAQGKGEKKLDLTAS